MAQPKAFGNVCLKCLMRSLGVNNVMDLSGIDPSVITPDDFFICDKCWAREFVSELQGKMFQCGYCSLWFESETARDKHVNTCQLWGWAYEKEDSMLYIHYEVMQIPPDLVAASEGSLEPEMIKLKFSSSASDCVLNFKRDGALMNTLVTIMKQIPASHRTFDSTDYIWTIPRSRFASLELLANAQKIAGPTYSAFIVSHPDLFAFIHPPKVQEKNWADEVKAKAQFKTEAAEDFFRNVVSSQLSDQPTLEAKLTELMKQYVTFELKAGDKTDFMRAYKLTARRLHPDLGGDAAKMSELNSLWMQYKEVAK